MYIKTHTKAIIARSCAINRLVANQHNPSQTKLKTVRSFACPPAGKLDPYPLMITAFVPNTTRIFSVHSTTNHLTIMKGAEDE